MDVDGSFQRQTDKNEWITFNHLTAVLITHFKKTYHIESGFLWYFQAQYKEHNKKSSQNV